jgi:hypothetical protein
VASAAVVTATAMVGRSAAAEPRGKRIGFVDNTLDNFHSNVYLKAFRNELKGRGYTLVGGTALQVEPSKAWAAKNELTYFDDVKSLNEAVDCFAVLSPSDPKLHLELCEKTLIYGKPTFVDKTFAPDAATAQKIFDLADKHHAPVQTTSALRYTAVQAYVKKLKDPVRHIAVWNPGRLYDEYIVHGVEMAVSCMGHEATRLMRRDTGTLSQVIIEFTGGRGATVHMYATNRTPYAAMVSTDKISEYMTVDTKQLFVDAAAAMLDFFDHGKNDIDRRETMTVMKIIDASKKPEALTGWVSL